MVAAPSLEDVLRDPPRPHEQDGRYVSMLLPGDALRFIHRQLDGSGASLETGCGCSTVVFAMTGARHTVIAPLRSEFDVLREYCAARAISTERVDFVAGPSQTILPGLDTGPLDLVLIDGCHGFPAPYLDWFYTAGALRIGGYLIVDDTWIWSCQILRDFLAAQPEWELVEEYRDRTAVFRKLAHGAELLDWNEQPLVATAGRRKIIDGELRYRTPFRHTPLGRAFGDLRRGDFRSLTRKVRNRLFPRG
jgi:predicted O-methyltransferase YrrM